MKICINKIKIKKIKLKPGAPLFLLRFYWNYVVSTNKGLNKSKNVSKKNNYKNITNDFYFITVVAQKINYLIFDVTFNCF